MTYGFETTTDDVIDGVDLNGTIAVVTGASAGIGVETARALAAAGAHVVLAARNAERTEAAAELDPRARPRRRRRSRHPRPHVARQRAGVRRVVPRAATTSCSCS